MFFEQRHTNDKREGAYIDAHMCRCDCCTVYSVVADIRGTRTRRKSWLTFFFFLLLLYVCGVCCGERIFRERREKTIKRWLHRLSRVTMLLSSTLSSRLHSRWLELFIFFFCSLALLLVRCNSMCTFPLSLLRFAPPPPLPPPLPFSYDSLSSIRKVSYKRKEGKKKNNNVAF